MNCYYYVSKQDPANWGTDITGSYMAYPPGKNLKHSIHGLALNLTDPGYTCTDWILDRDVSCPCQCQDAICPACIDKRVLSIVSWRVFDQETRNHMQRAMAMQLQCRSLIKRSNEVTPLSFGFGMVCCGANYWSVTKQALVKYAVMPGVDEGECNKELAFINGTIHELARTKFPVQARYFCELVDSGIIEPADWSLYCAANYHALAHQDSNDARHPQTQQAWCFLYCTHVFYSKTTGLMENGSFYNITANYAVQYADNCVIVFDAANQKHGTCQGFFRDACRLTCAQVVRKKVIPKKIG